MSLTLILTRHAKSSWHDASLDDFDRPLKERGKRSAVAVGRWLEGLGQRPEEVMVSGARRTVDTWTEMAPQFMSAGQMRSVPALFHAGAPAILGVLQTAQSQRVMVICHNPGIADFASRIVAEPPDHPRFADYPTCATTVVEFDVDTWREIGWGRGRAVNFAIPRELE